MAGILFLAGCQIHFERGKSVDKLRNLADVWIVEISGRETGHIM